jgi:lipid-binding SYLF domain-containing protein
MRRSKSLFIAGVVLAIYCAAINVSTARPVHADTMREAIDQTNKASKVFDEIMDAPDKGISRDLLEKVECVAVFPSVIKAAFIFGGKGGKGLVSCRDRESRAWGPPVFLKIGGGSVGFQIGAEATDLILLGMNASTIDTFRKNRFELGGEATAAAGPVGRSASASTDLPTIRSQFISYSRSRGAFAGVALKGSIISRDTDLTNAAYGEKTTAENVLDGKVTVSSEMMEFQNTLSHYAPGRGRRRSGN